MGALHGDEFLFAPLGAGSVDAATASAAGVAKLGFDQIKAAGWR